MRKTQRIYGSKVRVILDEATRSPMFTADHFAGWPKYSTGALLFYMTRTGQIKRISKGKPGCHGTPAVYGRVEQ